VTATVRVVLVGGGYANVWAYRAVHRALGRRAHVTLVSPHTHHSFHGFTSEALAGELAAGLAHAPLAEALPAATLLLGRVTAVDPASRAIKVDTADGVVALDYDHLVVATGATERAETVPGLAEHGWSLRVADSQARLAARLDELDAGGPYAVVVVGGGVSGTEVAAALARRPGRRRVVLVSSTGAPAREFGARARAMLLEGLQRSGVEVRGLVRATRVTEARVELSDGTGVDAAVVVSALGNQAVPLPGLEGHAGEDGRLLVRPTLELLPGVWAAGDCAAVPLGSGLAPTDALAAIRAGTRVGRNIARTERARRPRPLRYAGLGSTASLGPGRAVTQLGRATMWGWAPYTGRVLSFLWFLPSRRQAARMVLGAARR
jgi:NADH:ubiquinone reductase (H+-translocating)